MTLNRQGRTLPGANSIDAARRPSASATPFINELVTPVSLRCWSTKNAMRRSATAARHR